MAKAAAQAKPVREPRAFHTGLKGEHDWEFLNPGFRCRACKVETMDLNDLRKPDCKRG